MKELAVLARAAQLRASLSRLRPTKLAAVAIPISARAQFTADEKRSLLHLDRHLGAYDAFFIAPEGLALPPSRIGVKYFPRRYFGSVLAHRDLILSPGLYHAFRDYRFLLVYHLDALVFRDELERWCRSGYDYIGAPWVAHPEAPYAGDPFFEGQVGNGGFSLRNVESFLRLLLARRHALDPAEYARGQPRNGSHWDLLPFAVKRMLMRSTLFNNAAWELARLHYASEERFLVHRAAHFLPGFKIAPPHVALQFAFECVPRHCFELNQRQLPFGCHAWRRYDPEFWEPYLLEA
jgi:hypothetical protein